jgi:hypothetical protein
VIADAGADAGGKGSSADHPAGVGLRERVLGELV